MTNQVIWITASAGAGKTTALVKRYEELLRRCKPEQIVGITFTVNAAKEMCDRLRLNSTLQDESPLSRGRIGRIQTIHSLCHHILSIHAHKTIRILDPHEKALLIQQATRMALDEPTELTQKLARRFSGYHLQNVVEKILAKWRPDKGNYVREEQNLVEQQHIFDRLLLLHEDDKIPPFLAAQLRANYIDVFLTKSGDIRKRILDAATAKQYPDLVEVMAQEAKRIYAWQQELAVQEWFYDNDLIYQLIDRVWAHYITLKQDQKDYDELLSETQVLLEDDVIRYDICKNIRHVLLDEAQDTNPKQWCIIELLTQHLFDDPNADKSFFVVGDHKQSIYGFQNASPEFMNEQKQKYQSWAGKSFVQKNLENNYRCTKEICDYVQTACAVPVTNVARNHQGFVLEVTDFDETLAKFLNDPPFLPSQNRPLELRDIMILCRKRDKTYHGIIEKYGEQVRYEQTQLLSELPDIQYLMHVALLAAEPDNAYAKYKVTTIGCHPRIESNSSKISGIQFSSGSRLCGATHIVRDDSSITVIDLITQTLSHNQPLLNLVLTFVAQHQITTPKSLYWWLRAYPHSLKTVSTNEPNSMHLLTMHGAKGLQAPVVFVFNNWTPYHQQDIWWDHETGDFALPPTKNIHHPILTNIRNQNVLAQTAEDARLRYVAFTRAMDVLVVVS